MFTSSNFGLRKSLSNSDRHSFFKNSHTVSSSSTCLAALKEGAYERIAELREELLQLGNDSRLFSIFDVL